MIFTRVKGKNELWYLESESYSAIFRSVNGHDLQYLEDEDFDLSTTSAAYKLVKRLEVSTKSDLDELDLPEFNAIIATISRNLLEKQLLKPVTWLELVFICGGKRFDPSWEPWLEVPIPTLLGMAEIAKKYLQSL